MCSRLKSSPEDSSAQPVALVSLKRSPVTFNKNLRATYLTNEKQRNVLLHREREEDREMAAFLQSKFPKTLAAKGESNHKAIELPIKKKSWLAVISVATISLRSWHF